MLVLQFDCSDVLGERSDHPISLGCLAWRGDLEIRRAGIGLY